MLAFLLLVPWFGTFVKNTKKDRYLLTAHGQGRRGDALIAGIALGPVIARLTFHCDSPSQEVKRPHNRGEGRIDSRRGSMSLTSATTHGAKAHEAQKVGSPTAPMQMIPRLQITHGARIIVKSGRSLNLDRASGYAWRTPNR
jgi:hypothetical protein